MTLAALQDAVRRVLLRCRRQSIPEPALDRKNGNGFRRSPQAGGLARFLILLFFMVCPLAVFSTISITKSPLFAFSFVWWFSVWYELVQTWHPAGTRKHPQTPAIATPVHLRVTVSSPLSWPRR